MGRKNITPLTKSPEAQPGSEARLRRILDTVVAFVGTLTTDGIVTEANEPALASANLQREDVIGKPFWECYWWNYAAPVQESLREAIGWAACGEMVRYDVDVRVAGGEFITIDFQIAPGRNDQGTVIELIASGVNITERKRAERALRDSEARLSQVLDNVSTFIGLLDRDGVVREANRASLEAGGVTRDQVIGKPFAETAWWSVSADVQQQLSDIVARCLAGERVRQDMEYRFADRENRWVDFQLIPVFAEDGKVIGAVPSGVDITERKKIERAYAESVAAYRLALASARSGAWEWNVSEERIVWSPEVEALLGITRDQLPGTMSEFLLLTPAEDQARVRAAIDHTLTGGDQDYEVECRVRRGDTDKLIWIRMTGQVAHGEDGQPIRVRGLISDIDELRLTQEVASERDIQIQNLLNSTAEGIYGIGLDGKCTFANPACARCLGYDSPDELIGRNMHDLIHNRHADGQLYPVGECPIYQSNQTGERIHVESEVFWRKDGTNFPVEYWSYPLEVDGAVTGSVVTFLDITARRQAELALKTAANRLQLAVDVGEFGVWDWDMATNTMEWSDNHYPLAGYTVGEVTPSYDAWRSRVHPDDVERIEEALILARQGNTTYEASYRFLHPDGNVLHVNARGQFFYNETGQPIRMIGILDNITKQKSTEAHREMLMGELNHRVKNTLATIQAMASQTLRSAPNTAAFRDTFNGRLQAIATAHEILTDTERAGARLIDLISRQVGPYGDLDGGQIRLGGPDVRLDPTSAHAMGLVLHELATNAAKHGALSNSSGAIDITWKLHSYDKRQMIHLHWNESDGPPVRGPAAKGFGSRLIEQTLIHSLAGDVKFSYDPKGFNAALKVPMQVSREDPDAGFDP